MTVPFAPALLSDALSVLAVYAFIAVVGVVVLFGERFRMMIYEELHAPGADSSVREKKTNCPSCGARSTAEPAACDYCGEPLSDDGPPEYGRADE